MCVCNDFWKSPECGDMTVVQYVQVKKNLNNELRVLKR